MGEGQGRRGPSRASLRRSRHRKDSARGGAEAARRGAALGVQRISMLTRTPQHGALPGRRVSPAAHAISRMRFAGGETRAPGGVVDRLPILRARSRFADGKSAVASGRREVPEPHGQPGPAEAAHPRVAGRVALRKGGRTSGTGHMGGPALGRPFDAGIARHADRAPSQGIDHDRLYFSAHVRLPLVEAVARHRNRGESARRRRSGVDGPCGRQGSRFAAPCREAHRRKDRWRAALRRGTDEDAVGNRGFAGGHGRRPRGYGRPVDLARTLSWHDSTASRARRRLLR